ncbi:MAG TPA: hypothetical protein VHI78_12755, partial [Bacteroidales bacterium]|nr:hypothetical protein [Bacteroidales bacterium]
MKDQQLFVILVIICILTHIIRSIYEILKHRKIITPNRVSFVLMFTNMLLLWTSWFGLCRFDPQALEMPVIFRYSGIALVALGIVAFLIALFTIKSLE